MAEKVPIGNRWGGALACGDSLAQAAQQPAALRRGEPAPVAVEGGASGRDRRIDVGPARARNGGEGQPVGRADDVEDAPVGGRPSLAADQVEMERAGGASARETGCDHDVLWETPAFPRGFNLATAEGQKPYSHAFS